jgi:hypothetical protein
VRLSKVHLQRLAVCLSLIFSLCPARAADIGTLVGTVVDASGATVPGVVVSASNLATNFKREATTDQAGSYAIPYLPAGNYHVTASHTGF